MMTRLPTGSGIPVPLVSTSAPCPGAQMLRKGDCRNWASVVPGSAASPKHVQPLPMVWFFRAMAAIDGGTKNKAA